MSYALKGAALQTRKYQRQIGEQFESGRDSSSSLSFFSRYENQFLVVADRTNIMGKKLHGRSKQKKSRSSSARQINTQKSEDQIITQGLAPQIIIQDCEAQIITQDCQLDIITQDCDPGIVTQGFDCVNEDGILYSIISSLPIKEAGRTCVLSHRWKHIWKYLSTLTFDQSILDDETLQLYERFLTWKDKCHLLIDKTDDFIQLVDSVLQQHQGRARVNEINVRYFLHKAHSHGLDAWIHFAVASKTRILYLHLEQPHSSFNVELYDFPSHLLASSSIEELYLVCCTLKPPYQLDGLNRLRILVMWYPGDIGEDINHLVSHCSNLERLDVLGSKELVILSIPHSLSQLRRLTVEECDHLTKIEIKAVNLNYMGYVGVPVDFVLRQTSCLKKAKIYFKTEGCDHTLNFYLTKLANDLPYLHYLTLNISGVSKVENLPKCSPSFICLKRLNWECPEWSVGVKINLLHLDTLLDAAPFLEELKLNLSTCGVEEPPPRVTKLKKKLPTHPRPHLKTVEISGFYFERWQLLIVLYLLNNAIKLESITLEKGLDSGKEISETDMNSLTQQVPPNVKLVIL